MLFFQSFLCFCKSKRIFTVFIATSIITLSCDQQYEIHSDQLRAVASTVHDSLYWDWSIIEPIQVNFSKEFLWGAGVSAHQVEGNNANNTWSRFEAVCDSEGQPYVQACAGKACDHWNRYKEDISLAKKAGLTAFRFSIEWSRIYPTENTIDYEALKHYASVIKEVLDNGMTPFINLHHYTDPLWFADKGGFENDNNITFFVQYVHAVMLFMKKELGSRLHTCKWLTFNSPEGYAAKGWLQGVTPPCKKSHYLYATVLCNVLHAHVRAYQIIKSIDARMQVGFMKNIYQLDPLDPTSMPNKLVCAIGNEMQNGCIYRFLTTGHFRMRVPTPACLVSLSCSSAVGAYDFIGLNYYSHALLSIKGERCIHARDVRTQNPDYAIYPEGLYRAIEEVSQRLARPLRVPIYVTENGVAACCKADRELFFKRYIYALSQAIEDGHDVRGYINWSLLDNYEWGSYSKKYGIYAVNFDAASPDYLKRTLKDDEGTRYFLACVRRAT